MFLYKYTSDYSKNEKKKHCKTRKNVILSKARQQLAAILFVEVIIGCQYKYSGDYTKSRALIGPLPSDEQNGCRLLARF